MLLKGDEDERWHPGVSSFICWKCGLCHFAVSAFWRLARFSPAKERCQQIIGLDDVSFSIAVRIDAKEESMLGKMFGNAVRRGVAVMSLLYWKVTGLSPRIASLVWSIGFISFLKRRAEAGA